MRLKLPDSLHYPITVTELLQRPDDQIDLQTPLFSYYYRTTVTEGDRDGEDHEVEKNFPTRYESPVEGVLKRWNIREGTVIKSAHVEVADIEEPCSHSVQFGGMCTQCGKDMTEVGYNLDVSNTARAQINMAHVNNSLTISQDEATRVETEAKLRLLRSQKLSLVVDLDQTIIHATVDPTVAEWQKDPDNPNYAAVKDVRQFKLDDEVPGGGHGCWYYIKLRPGLTKFLETVSKLYELHIYTMGTRAYARHIARIVDPDRKLFGDRILSRDESGSMTAKSLQRLFPVDTKMVVIIDDRGDVWKWSDNLVKVTPYDFFVGIGDINSSFLPKKVEMQTSEKVNLSGAPGPSEEVPRVEKDEISPVENGATETSESTQVTGSQVSAASDVSTLEQLVSMGGGDNPSLLKEQATQQDQALTAQLEDRPLLQQQKRLDAEDEASTASASDEAADDQKGPSESPSPTRASTDGGSSRHNLLHDDDTELEYLGRSLTDVHRAFFDEYDAKLARAKSNRIQLLRGDRNGKKIPSQDSNDLEMVPDIKNIMPQMKLRVLEGVVLVLSGVVPLGTDIQRSDIAVWAKSFGARIMLNVNKQVTHVVAARNRTAKVRQAARMERVKVVKTQWLIDSISQWRRIDEAPYLIQLHPDDLKRKSSDASDKGETFRDEGSLSSSDDDDDESGGDEGNGDEPEDGDEENDSELVPADLDANQSPVDGFQGYDWKGVEDDLAEFLGSDDEDSDGDSNTSESTIGNTTPKKKRKRSRSASQTRDGFDGGGMNGEDAGSRLAKRQQLARARTTGLKTVATPQGDGDGNDDNLDDIPASSAATNETGSFAVPKGGKVSEELNDDDFLREIEAEIEKEFEDD